MTSARERPVVPPPGNAPRSGQGGDRDRPPVTSSAITGAADSATSSLAGSAAQSAAPNPPSGEQLDDPTTPPTAIDTAPDRRWTRRAAPRSSGQRASRQPRVLGLRARVTVAFAFGALVLSAVLSGITYGLVRSSLVVQREESAVSQAYLNARLVRDGLRSPGGDLGRVLVSLETPVSGGVVVRHGGRWFANSLVVGRDTLPTDVRRRVSDGRPARQRFRLGGRTWIAVGVPIPRVQAQFFEAFSLAEVDRTLGVLVYSLAGAALLTTLGGAAVGRWVSGRVLRPLGVVSDAAAAIASGRLDTRLGPVADPDLAPLAESFNRMVDAVTERIERDARFASDVSHELRSPLTTLSASLDVLKARRDELPERARAALDLIDADLYRFQRLVEDLLEMSRVEAGLVDTQFDDVDLAVLVRHALERTTSTVPLEVDPALDGARVLGDKRRLERVVGNLVENAAAHGGGATCVRVERVDGPDGGVRLVVEDGGPGVPVDERTQVFDRFFRGSAAGRRGAGHGTGLGLALVADHVRVHGGQVWVEDGPDGVGSRFVVELPELPPNAEGDGERGRAVDGGGGDSDDDGGGTGRDAGAGG
jgi:two-component system sensor histidine kinase MtrB